MRIVYADGDAIDIGHHVFPTRKYGLVRAELLARGLAGREQFVPAPPAAWEDLALVHTPRWLDRLREFSLSLQDITRLELPATADTVEGFRLMCGGTIEAARHALDDGVGLTLGGGLHHAFEDHGEGFCMFNDVAVAVRVLQRDGRIRRAAIVDLDVHHGNGTAAVFAGDADVLTLSMHQWNNYPAEKPPSTIDVHLPDGTGDAEYLERLREALPAVAAHRPDLVVYLAGADPFHDDQLGGLNLSHGGLRARDRAVFDALLAEGIPVAVTLAGGYSRRVEDTVAIHVATVDEAMDAWQAARTDAATGRS